MNQQIPNFPQFLSAAITNKAPHFVRLQPSRPCTTVASYNVHKCVGSDGVFDPARIVSVIRELDADIVAIQEADQRLGKKEGLLDLDFLAEMTGLVPVYKPTRSLSHGWHGNLLLLRNGQVRDVKTIRLPGMEPRGAVMVDLELKGVELRVIAAHFGLLRRSRSQQASILTEMAMSTHKPTLLLGDLNEWRVKSRSSLAAFLPHFGPLEAIVPSFPSRFPLLALDRILARPISIISSIEVHRTALARVASDHLPLKAKLNLSSLRQTSSAREAA
jgi:endonuclease/exonuclease/phosphatase family metal-dependent hydrolase